MKNLIPSEIQRLLAVIRPRSPFGARDHALVRLAFATGLRVGELVALDVGLVWASGRPRSWLDLPARLCKGHRSRRVALSPAAQQAVSDLVAFLVVRGLPASPESPLLCNRFGRRLPDREVQKLMQHLREAAQLEWRATPHSLRHGFASRLAAAGVNLRIIQQLLGHQRLSSTEIYLHCQPEELVEAVGVIEF